MAFVSRLVNGFLDFFDRDHPCNQLYDRALKLSNPSELDPVKRGEGMRESLGLYSQALGKCRSKNPGKHRIHLNYGLALHACFEQDKNLNMSNNAITQMQEADACWPLTEKTGATYSNFQTNLGTIFLERYLALKDESDLEGALKAGETALSSCPSTSAHQERFLALLLRGRAGCAGIKTKETLSPTHLKQPIDDLNQAIQLPIKDKHLKGSCHYNLAIAHNLRYKKNKMPEDLSQAIDHGTEADGLLEGHRDQGACLLNLAQTYTHQCEYKVEIQKKSCKDTDVAQLMTETRKMLDRATKIGDDSVKKECEQLRQQIQLFDPSNTTEVSSTSGQSPSPPIPAPKSEDPEAEFQDSAVEEGPPALFMRISNQRCE